MRNVGFQIGRNEVDGSRAILLDRVSADLANQRILVAGSAAAADRTYQLAAFNQWKTAGRCDETRIEGPDIGMAGFVHVVPHLGRPPVARRRPRLALRD